ncbi:hypothetical protein [Loigolactobacillus binensis]|uniref:LPXTG cell wall anchor domain-containing protein n=1 Tax=Loigolactobacillus binensis TaxID=2559922 RepID=A0ABW3EFM3_9LACO|nr:hypothetical protein [Loigolactobacillus binensis]
MRRFGGGVCYLLVLVLVGYSLVQASDWFWLLAAGGLMLLSVGLGRFFRRR